MPASHVFYGLFAICGILIIIIRPKFGIVIIIVSAFILEGAVFYRILPPLGLWTIDIFILFLVARLIITNSPRQKTALVFRVQSALFVLWCISLIISGISNNVSIGTIILGMRPYLRFFIFSYCIVTFNWNEYFLEKCLRLLTLLFLIQVPIQIFQRLAKLDIDYISGTLAQATGLLSICSIGVFSGLVMYASKRHKSLYWILASALLLVPVLGSVKAFFFGIPIIVSYVFVRVVNRRNAFGIVVISLVMIVILQKWDDIQEKRLFGSDQNMITEILKNPSDIVKDLWNTGYVNSDRLNPGRLEAIRLNIEFLSSYSKSSLWIGLGPGVSQGSRIIATNQEKLVELSWVGSTTSQLTTSLTEWGIIGVTFYICIYLISWFRAEAVVRSDIRLFWKATSFGFSTFVLASVLGIVYAHTWGGSITAFCFWLGNGIIMRFRNTRELDHFNHRGLSRVQGFQSFRKST